jgi:hypothetical protein
MLSDLFWQDYPRFWAGVISPILAGYLYTAFIVVIRTLIIRFFDLLLIITYWEVLRDVPIIFHHSILISVVFFGGTYKILFSVCVFFALNELSTVFLNFRYEPFSRKFYALLLGGSFTSLILLAGNNK